MSGWESITGTLKSVKVTSDEVQIITSKGTWRFVPEGDCCANAYVHEPGEAKADLTYLVGSKIVECHDESNGCEEHNGEYRDINFYIIQTEKGSATITLYVDHNGYYGGSLVGGKQ